MVGMNVECSVIHAHTSLVDHPSLTYILSAPTSPGRLEVQRPSCSHSGPVPHASLPVQECPQLWWTPHTKRVEESGEWRRVEESGEWRRVEESGEWRRVEESGGEWRVEESGGEWRRMESGGEW